MRWIRESKYLAMLTEISRHHDIVVPVRVDRFFLHHDEGDRGVLDHPKGIAPRDVLHPFHAMGSHEDQVGVHLGGRIPDVLEDAAHPDHGMDVHGILIVQGLDLLVQLFPSFIHILPFLYDMEKIDFSIDDLRCTEGMSFRTFSGFRKISGYQDLFLAHE
jgi:hypothetical protein